MRLACMACGRSVSTEVPDNTRVKGWLECPECIERGDDAIVLRKEYKEALARLSLSMGIPQHCALEKAISLLDCREAGMFEPWEGLRRRAEA